ncbi:LptA/OstA family protein [Maricaulis sp.]|uniref:LptA/OstA family protein n=1 Tax=Maricaulis sp. TaxID=1486257 RepID=UPI0032968285
MMRLTALRACAAVLVALVLAPTALTSASLAQIGDSRLPLDIEADHSELFNPENRAVWTGNVNVVQGTSSLRADRIEVFFDGQSTGSGPTGNLGNIERIVATGNVFYTTPEQRARGDRGVYLLAEETITLTGDVVITQGEDVFTATRFVTDLVTGNSSFGEAGDGARVRMVIHPRGNEEAADPDEGEGNGGGTEETDG